MESEEYNDTLKMSADEYKHSEFDEKHTVKSLVEGINDTLKVTGELAESIINSDASKMMMNAIASVAKYVNQLPPIKIPDLGNLLKNITIPSYLTEAVDDYRFQKLCTETGWPLYRIDRESQKRILEDSNKQNANSMCDFALNYFDDAAINSILDDWKESKVVDSRHIPELSEAIQLYKGGSYYGCVAICSCALTGVIDEVYAYALNEGVNFSEDYFAYLYEQNNDGRKPDPGILNNVSEHPTSLKGGKQQLICAATGAEDSFIFWNEVSKYIYSVVLSSDPKAVQWNQPCRNKICHGEKSDYGNRDIALKAILTLDLVYLLGAALYKSGGKDYSGDAD